MRASVVVGLDALRLNPLRTVLSTLGVIMGVGALVSVLSMSDGVERFSREQLARTTDLLAVGIEPVVQRRLDGQWLPRPDTVRFGAADAEEAQRWPGVASAAVTEIRSALVRRGPESAPRGVRVLAGTAYGASHGGLHLVRGEFLHRDDVAQVRRVILLGRALAAALDEPAVGDSALVNGAWFLVRGVVDRGAPGDSALVAYVPLGTVPLPGRAATAGAPQLVVQATDIKDVAGIKARAERVMAARYGPGWRERVSVRANDERRAQTEQAMAVFKLLMAAITGVSLLVGGVGIMNVMLASVAERTREIGVRKAVGARAADIRAQFLSESVAITAVGATLGVASGLAVAEVAALVMRVQTKAPVHPVLTPATLAFAVLASVTVGLVFGLYPALRASRLSPIDAIRHD